jgi:pimeloyl-ACP methyl ester carboxylesterase
MRRAVCLAILCAVAVLPAGAATPAGTEAVGPSEAVVLIHGLGRSARAMAPLAERLRAAGFDAFNLDYPSREADPATLVDGLAIQIADCCASAPRLHFVGHSLGGILARAYVDRRQPANLGRMVLLSPPSRGSQIVDQLGDTWIFGTVMGPSAELLGTDGESFPLSLPTPDFELGIIAATESINPVGSVMIPGEDDGMVAVCNMVVEGMTDFITVDQNHAFVMRGREVAEQTILFLREGRFSEDERFREFDPAICDHADDE